MYDVSNICNYGSHMLVVKGIAVWDSTGDLALKVFCIFLQI